MDFSSPKIVQTRPWQARSLLHGPFDGRNFARISEESRTSPSRNRRFIYIDFDVGRPGLEASCVVINAGVKFIELIFRFDWVVQCPEVGK